ncbi:Flavonoid 3',5'-hydroxylase 2, partial [Linum perenne]
HFQPLTSSICTNTFHNAQTHKPQNNTQKSNTPSSIVSYMALNLTTNMLHDFQTWYTSPAMSLSSSSNVDFAKFLVTVLIPLAAFSSFLVSVLTKKWATKGAPLPPGPTGLPIVGYLPFLGVHLHHEFVKLAATYGPVYKMWLGTKLCVVVSSPSLVKEVVRDQDSVFANRDPPIASVVLTYGCDDVAFSNYGPLWKKLRKVFVREMLSSASLEACYVLRKEQVRNSVKEVYKRCGDGAMDVGEMAFKTTTNAMMSMLWGGVEEAIGKSSSSFYGEFRELETEMLVLMGTPNVSDFVPALARFDLQGIEKKSKMLLEKFDVILSSAIEERLRLVERRGDTRKDFLQVLLDLNRAGHVDTNITTNQVKALLMDILVGGTDTTATMIEWTMAELVKHPSAMVKVNEELDQVVGQNMIVEESHLHKLHYLEAVIKETFRLHPALPLLVPRCPSQTCELGGYTIPKGTIVYLNAYALHTDPELWDEPLEFKPERFLEVEDNVKYDFQGNNFQFLPFGSGRRVCPGQPLGVNTQKYVLATLLHSFEWKLPRGSELELSDKFGIVIKKMNPLILVPTPRLSNLELY